MAKKPTLTDLKKELRKKTQNELVEEIAHLYKTFSNVKEFYQTSFFNDDSAVLEKYKQIVQNEFIATGRSLFPKMRASVARKAISDYKKVSCSNIGIADIMLTYVESGVHCTNEYGDIDEPFYNSMESMYESALKYMVKEDLLLEFQDRAEDIVTNTSHCGWGFHDELNHLYHAYYREDEQ
ncbi:DUF6155 family protein [Oceanospirillum beijerinckii]|uniref:DUF6155 family protein n=1 Tax=Oceanospirillum beijerinckii TaxID=64976 RepID=UPI000419532E|nr:DUF6155 family protein [Oceanospirillum beijerinckii]